MVAPTSVGDAADLNGPAPQLTKLPFPPVKKSHILHCSFHYWHPLYRVITPKARLIPLTTPFVEYLRADGIVLPPDGDENLYSGPADDDSGIFSESEASDSDDEDSDPSAQWQEVHGKIKSTIQELGGKVAPKLNWSAPKDATWMSATNDMTCRSANDIYLLLKSSDFITHDLEQAYDDCVEDEEENPEKSKTVEATEATQITSANIPYHLVLRKYFQMNPSLEFRCFVRNRRLLCACQRDLNHFEFLFPLRDNIVRRIQDFFDVRLRDTFPDSDFVFDVYVPPPHDRCWLIDINPFAPRTDPLLFSWLEILEMSAPNDDHDELGSNQQIHDFDPEAEDDDDVDSLSDAESLLEGKAVRFAISTSTAPPPAYSDSEDDSDTNEDILSLPELRLITRDDPEAYSFATPQYSAHKLPREVVDASREGSGGLREFLTEWKEVLAQSVRADEEYESESDGEVTEVGAAE